MFATLYRARHDFLARVRSACVRGWGLLAARHRLVSARSLSSVFLSTVGEQHPCAGAVPVRVHGFAHRRGGRNPRSYYKGNLGFAAQPPAKNAPAGCTSNFASLFRPPFCKPTAGGSSVRLSKCTRLVVRIMQRKALGTELMSTFPPQVSIKGPSPLFAHLHLPRQIA